MTAELVPSLLPTLRKRRDQLRRDLLTRMEQGESDADLRADVGALCDLEERVTSMESEDERAGNTGALLARLGGDTSARNTQVPIREDHLTYRKNGDPSASWVRDVAKATLDPIGASGARERLARHAEEVRHHPTFSGTEYRDLSRTDGDGGYFVPPAWLIDEYVSFARAGRVFADRCSLHPLPGGTDSINVPKILTGTATAIQTADNTQVFEQDLTDTYINSPVRTIAGQQSVAIQLIDQSPISMDAVILADLTKAQAQNVDQQVLYGTGTNGQILGVSNTGNIGTVAIGAQTIQGFYNAVANAYSKIWSTRFDAPNAIIIHPTRYAWLLSLLDDNSRPLFVPRTQNPMNAAGIQGNVEPQGWVGTMMGLDVFTDANITTSAGSGSPTGTEDVAYVLKTDDVVIFESGLRARVLPETLAQTLSVLIQVYSFLAIGVRYPASIVEITGLTAPSF